MVKYANGDCQNDSTFVLERVDQLYSSRPIIPAEPLNRFYSLLLEDMFDEWGTKIMFGMRWLEQVDQEWSARYLLYDGVLGSGLHLSQLTDMGKQFGSRQVGRMKIVGCDNSVMVERSLTSLLTSLEHHLERGSMFMLGPTPTVADFALYGQLSQIIIDRSGDKYDLDLFSTPFLSWLVNLAYSVINKIFWKIF